MSVRAVVTIVLLAAPSAEAGPIREALKYHDLDKFNAALSGQVLDYTFNHGKDRRIYSKALDAKRDLYVYLPPGYDPRVQYPVIVFLHGFAQDETFCFEVLPFFDKQMADGKMPPTIIAVPDGSLGGRPSVFFCAGSFYLNSRAGRFGDFVTQDVWGFLNESFPLRPERGAHVLAGGSMGGFAAYNLGFKNRETFGVLAGVLAPLHLRWCDCTGDRFGDYARTASGSWTGTGRSSRSAGSTAAW